MLSGHNFIFSFNSLSDRTTDTRLDSHNLSIINKKTSRLRQSPSYGSFAPLAMLPFPRTNFPPLGYTTCDQSAITSGRKRHLLKLSIKLFCKTATAYAGNTITPPGNQHNGV